MTERSEFEHGGRRYLIHHTNGEVLAIYHLIDVRGGMMQPHQRKIRLRSERHAAVAKAWKAAREGTNDGVQTEQG